MGMRIFGQRGNVINNIGGGNSFSSVIMNGDKVIINGVEIKIPPHRSLSINNGKVFVDGVELKLEGAELSTNGPINVTIYGDVQNVNCGGSVSVTGNVSGDIDCGGGVVVDGNVDGDIDCGGGVEISGDHKGSIDAGGSVSIR